MYFDALVARMSLTLLQIENNRRLCREREPGTGVSAPYETCFPGTTSVAATLLIHALLRR